MPPNALKSSTEYCLKGGRGGTLGHNIQSLKKPLYGDVWCAGHRWQAHVSTTKTSSVVP